MSADILEQLAQTIAARAGADPSTSYTAKLLAGGVERAGKKFAEEAAETLIAAVAGKPHELAAESADMLYHWLVLLQASNVPLSAVWDALAQRTGTSGLTEKASRKTT
jgi:phosphoribosyl-ATP pyrophosphohydrolase